LRDADSSNPGFESHYRTLRDDYSTELAFFTYRALIPRLAGLPLG
jgi:hypothetical protein